MKHDKQEIMKKGKMVEPLNLEGAESLAEFIEKVFSNSGFNARRLAEACHLYERMLQDDTTIALTLAGAMTPIGMGGPVIDLIEKGFVDLIITTGANIYHDLHRAFDLPVVQGDFRADDNALRDAGIARIYDTYIEDGSTLMATDKVILDAFKDRNTDKPVSTADLHDRLGRKVLKDAPSPEKSFLAAAVKSRIPVYTSSPGDSSIGMNLVVFHFFGKKLLIDPLLDIIETTAIIRHAEKNGVLIVGGGAPKNFYLQTQPTLWQILRDETAGHDYFIQLTTDTPVWGGLSGATPQEAESWGKVHDPESNSVVVYSCASITFPIIVQYLNIKEKPRKPKGLMDKKTELVAKLKERTLKNRLFLEDYKNYMEPD
jgi:deoxyhypusine synthase